MIDDDSGMREAYRKVFSRWRLCQGSQTTKLENYSIRQEKGKCIFFENPLRLMRFGN